MSRWIDADALKKLFPQDSDWEYPVNTNEFVVECIDSAPSIDIVRCKVCKHRCTDDCPMCNECGRKAYPTSDDDFCSWGERKNDE